MTVRKMTILLFLTFIAVSSNAQTAPALELIDSASFTINKIPLVKNMHINQAVRLLGKPSRTVDYRNKEKSFFYDADGLVIFCQDSIIKGLGINFNWDGDKKFPENSFTGVLKIGGTTITRETNQEAIKNIAGIPFSCPLDILCGPVSRWKKKCAPSHFKIIR